MVSNGKQESCASPLTCLCYNGPIEPGEPVVFCPFLRRPEVARQRNFLLPDGGGGQTRARQKLPNELDETVELLAPGYSPARAVVTLTALGALAL